MFIRGAEEFVVWFNMKHPGAPRPITVVDVENLKACELIHRHGLYLTSEDGKTVMGVLKYAQMMERRTAQEANDEAEPKKCKMCGEPLPSKAQAKKGRPKQYCLACQSSRAAERYRKWQKRKAVQVSNLRHPD